MNCASLNYIYNCYYNNISLTCNKPNHLNIINQVLLYFTKYNDNIIANITDNIIMKEGSYLFIYIYMYIP